MKLVSVFSTIAMAMSGVAAIGQQPEDALQLLDRVAKHYEEAESVHLEATIQSSYHSEMSEQTSLSVVTVYVAAGGRFRYEGKDSSGSAQVVSDGTTEWRLMKSFAEFAKAPAGTYFNSRRILQGDDRPLSEAHDLLAGITSLGSSQRAAHFLPEESLNFGGRSVRCRVVQLRSEDSSDRRSTTGPHFQTIVWIDPDSLIVLKEEFRSESHYLYGRQTPPFAPTTNTKTVTTFSVAELNFAPEADTFAFVAPANAKEVPKLPDAMAELSPPARDEAKEPVSARFLGKPLPPIVLRDQSGNEVALTRFAGRPLLIDVWATWCMPCVEELPVLDKIRRSTAGTDLQMLGVDEDAKSQDAVELLKRRSHDWSDLHYTSAMVKQLSMSTIPLLVLVDASGRVVYYHSGADDAKGLAAAIAALGKQYEQVRFE